MADYPFDERQPPPPQQQSQVPGTPPQSDLRGQWDSFLSSPAAGAFMLNAGISLMQPPSFGDNFASQLGRAVGHGAEAATRGEALTSKMEEAEARGEAARSRAGQSAAQADVAYQRLAHEKEKTSLQQRVKLALGYDNYRRAVEDRNSKAMIKYNSDKAIFPDTPQPVLEPVLSSDQWLDQQQRLTGDITGKPSGVGASGAGGGTNPPFPQDPKNARVGVVYDTPKGPKRWTGTGFVEP